MNDEKSQIIELETLVESQFLRRVSELLRIT
jgi:hypothetical protein